MTPTVGIYLRLMNDAGTVVRALDSVVAQAFEGPLRVTLDLDGGSTDRTEDIVRTWVGRHAKDRGNVTWVFVRHPHETLDAATRRLVRASFEDEIYFLDGDNSLRPDRVTAAIATGPVDGLCVQRCLRVLRETPELFPAAWPPRLDVDTLLRGNLVDTLQIRASGLYLRQRLLGLLEQVPADDLVDDYLMVLLAARDGRICHHDLIAGTYYGRPNSLTRRTDIGARMTRTLAAYARIARRNPPWGGASP